MARADPAPLLAKDASSQASRASCTTWGARVGARLLPVLSRSKTLFRSAARRAEVDAVVVQAGRQVAVSNIEQLQQLVLELYIVVTARQGQSRGGLQCLPAGLLSLAMSDRRSTATMFTLLNAQPARPGFPIRACQCFKSLTKSSPGTRHHYSDCATVPRRPAEPAGRDC